MPTPEEIKKIAKQYAEFTDGSPADKAYIRAITQCFLEWLCKTHCIVEKSKVREYAKHSKTFEPIDHLEFIHDIFGTELFNEEKE